MDLQVVEAKEVIVGEQPLSPPAQFNDAIGRGHLVKGRVGKFCC